MSVESLKEKMREFAEGNVQTVSISQADLSGKTETAGKPVSGTVTASVPDEAKNDGIMSAGATATGMRSGLIGRPGFLDEIDISEDDRTAFLDAIVSGGRYEREFSLFDGKLRGTFRCRSTQESDGIIAWLSNLVNGNKLSSNGEYLSAVRSATLAAQVKSLRGLVNEDMPELTLPLAPTRSADGKSVTPPGWVGLAEAWAARPEALVSAVYSELQKFESRYWAMVVNAADQNFWNPAAST